MRGGWYITAESIMPTGFRLCKSFALLEICVALASKFGETFRHCHYAYMQTHNLAVKQ